MKRTCKECGSSYKLATLELDTGVCSNCRISAGPQELRSTPLVLPNEATRYPEEMENRLCALALGRTVAFLIYSLLVWVICTVVIFIVLPQRLDDRVQGIVVITMILTLEGALLFLVAKGWMPGTKSTLAPGFSETQFITAANILAALSLLIHGMSIGGDAFRWVINAFILVCVLVFFVTKSVVSKKVRIRVLAGGILPVAQYFI